MDNDEAPTTRVTRWNQTSGNRFLHRSIQIDVPSRQATLLIQLKLAGERAVRVVQDRFVVEFLSRCGLPEPLQQLGFCRVSRQAEVVWSARLPELEPGILACPVLFPNEKRHLDKATHLELELEAHSV